MKSLAASRSLSRREARRLDRRDAIMDVAQTSFMRDGYAGTTMSAIAAALGGSKGTLWSHFPSKEELFAAVVDRATTAYRQQLAQILAGSTDDLPSTLLAVCSSFLAKLSSPEGLALHRLVMGEAGRFPEVGRIFYDRAPRAARTLLGAFLTDAMARGQLRPDDGERAARALMTLCMAGCHQKLMIGIISEPSPEMLDADAAFAVDIFLRAYAPPAP